MKRLANNIHHALDRIRANERLKESTKQFLAQQRIEQPARRGIHWKKLLAVCTLALFIAGFGGYSWVRMPVSYVSIDVNPSVELALNRLDRVAAVTAFNVEGEELIRGLSLKGKKYTDAIDVLVESDAMKSYLQADAELVFTVASDGARNDKLQAGIAHCHSHSGHNCYGVSADIGLVYEAHENGLSLGKYYAYLQLAAYDDTVTVGDCRNMSMSQIHRCIRAHGKHLGDRYADDDQTDERHVNDGQTDERHADDGQRDDERTDPNNCHMGHGYHGNRDRRCE